MDVRAVLRAWRGRMERVWEAREADWAAMRGVEFVRDMAEDVLYVDLWSLWCSRGVDFDTQWSRLYVVFVASTVVVEIAGSLAVDYNKIFRPRGWASMRLPAGFDTVVLLLSLPCRSHRTRLSWPGFCL